ncbi:glycoside hydrolase family 18 protein [Anaerocolumna xylanovorans]|uniref:chitinase n=1 Tax=Anaerocolumna xylanovorans DSM 12503 TaxID=1121345 RepID=A0A1M7YC84_9FIRM|nr:glycoside hydrolase family 18 protein [Anaerocolumna xylanovorans]SHO50250.1 chitinase [Anaerocolumna xylanovorans DSM 12503]
MKKRKIRLWVIGGVLLAAILTAGLLVLESKREEYVVSAYLPLWKQWNCNELKAEQLDILYIAFAGIGADHKITFADKTYLEKIKALREAFPDLTLCLAIGGYNSDGFSDAAYSEESRSAFTKSIMSFIQKYHLDGVDIDWEFPVNGGWGSIKCRKEDKQNFTYLLSSLRKGMDQLEEETGKRYELSFAATSADWGTEVIEPDQVQRLVDRVNLMSYDYTGYWESTTAHHSNLYKNPKSPIAININDSVKHYIASGIPAKKLVLGIPAYGRGWTGVTNKDNGLYQTAQNCIDNYQVDLSYNTLCKNYINKNGYVRHWDEQAKAPYLFNGNEFITYDDKKSVAVKMSYVKKHGLGGGMCWEYSQDQNGELIGVMHDILH